MSRRTQRPSRRYRLGCTDRPDFAQIYGSDTGALTPRMAHALWRSTRELEQIWHGCSDEPEELEYLLFDVPACVEQVADKAWLSRFSQRLRLVRTCLEVGDLSNLPACAGDELALYLVFDHADSEVFLWTLDNDEHHRQLPAYRSDEWFRSLAEILFPDSCVTELLEYAEDGGVYDEPSFNHRMAGARVDDWFPSSASDRGSSSHGGGRCG